MSFDACLLGYNTQQWIPHREDTGGSRGCGGGAEAVGKETPARRESNPNPVRYMITGNGANKCTAFEQLMFPRYSALYTCAQACGLAGLRGGL